mmetsp:Transcript_28245/g.45415  ORF Transcript_28245/g.45415 Transcript_28245/m.45415 type:complete len:216 (-) Transcript_28245:1494-2141(-)
MASALVRAVVTAPTACTSLAARSATTFGSWCGASNPQVLGTRRRTTWRGLTCMGSTTPRIQRRPRSASSSTPRAASGATSSCSCRGTAPSGWSPPTRVSRARPTEPRLGPSRARRSTGSRTPSSGSTARAPRRAPGSPSRTTRWRCRRETSSTRRPRGRAWALGEPSCCRSTTAPTCSAASWRARATTIRRTGPRPGATAEANARPACRQAAANF